MSAGLPAEGAIDIDLSVCAGTITGVTIRNRRLLSVPVSLAGCPSDEAVRRLSTLFAVCRIAQGLAGAEAVENASGYRVGAIHSLARRMLLLGETVLEHGSRATLDWPLLLGEPPLAPTVRMLRGALADLHRDLYPDGDWMRPGGGRLQPDGRAMAGRLAVVERCLRDAVFAGAAPLDATSWRHWWGEAETPAARLVAKLMGHGLAGFGASDVAPLPCLDPAGLAARLAADDGAYVARPDWRGAPHETGPLARRARHPLVVALVAEHGPGLLARFAARLVELAVCLREMQDFLDGLCNDDASWPRPASGQGLAAVEAARGRLVHRVELREGVVSRYQILAPTEWNFHPAGPLVRGLVGQPGGADPQARARLLVVALDPCVAYRLGVA